MTEWRFSLNILLFKEGDVWVAQCLQYDLVAQGSSIPEVKRRFTDVFVGQAIIDVTAGKKPFSDLAGASVVYRDRWWSDAATPLRELLHIHAVPQLDVDPAGSWTLEAVGELRVW
jgi:hypothetical protein